MVLLTTTPHILGLIAALPPSALTSIPSSDLPTTPGAPISHSTILTLSRLSKSFPSTTSQSCSLNTLLHGANPYTPPPPPTSAKSPGYITLMARLKAEQEQREYRSLVSNQIADETADRETREKDDISPSLVVNILLSIVMCAAAVFVMTRYWRNDGLRVLVSLGTGLVVGIAEVGMYAIYLRKVRVSKEKERAKRGKKFILEREEIGGKVMEGVTKGMGDGSTGEKEEIWGRGVNGGMRRRVREKWEREQQQQDNTT
jgi:TMEM199 family protein